MVISINSLTFDVLLKDVATNEDHINDKDCYGFP